MQAIENKKGMSAIIGYVLLITFGIILSIIVFNYLRTYVPSDPLDCPDGVSLFLKDYNYNCSSGELYLTLKNNGKFNVEGYFAYGASNQSVELGMVDLSKYFNPSLSQSGLSVMNVIYFNNQANISLAYGEEKIHAFNLDGPIYSLEIIPLRFQTDNNVERIILCGRAKLKQELVCT
ncbi:hypothetical protein COU58_01725 [Candidatus Pacearchaeota archaeon CG10_big_fil_rev_8_21_14_0_10_32_42]|nr:MAG: hypothetical protein COU58_01725 [Candidatus Pacearchaeota archaeon CG10_big_fil_rev_8_21_14_0_10_32_42]